MDIVAITAALNQVWDVKTTLEGKKPLYRHQRDVAAQALLAAVIAIKEQLGIP